MKKPSITELLSLLDKPALLKWANKQGLAGIDISEARSKYKSEGLSLHDQIECYIKDKKPFLDPVHQSMFEHFMTNKEVMWAEQKIETEWFTGRYDLCVKDTTGFRIVDFKRNQKGIYLENKLQLVAYSMAQPCDTFSIVSIPEFAEIKVEIKNRKPYEEILKSLSIIYTQKQLIDAGI